MTDENQKTSVFSLFSKFLPSLFKGRMKDANISDSSLNETESISISPNVFEENLLENINLEPPDNIIPQPPQNQILISKDTNPVNPPPQCENFLSSGYIEDIKDDSSEGTIEAINEVTADDIKDSVPSVIPPKNNMFFAGLGEKIKIGRYQISNPLTYWTDKTSHDASCINIRLPIMEGFSDDKLALPKYLGYSHLSPIQRNHYLAWLAAGKKTDLKSPGYLLIYFSGLERRVLVDKIDVDIIIPEIQRLLSLYSSLDSENFYLRKFLAYISGSSLQFSEQELHECFPDFTSLIDEEIITVLAWFCENEKPIPWQIAFSVARKKSQNTTIDALNGVEKELKLLFEQKYIATYPNGLKLISSKNLLNVGYQPINYSLATHKDRGFLVRTIYRNRLPNPLGKPTQFYDIIKIFDKSVESVQSLNRSIKKSGGNMTSETYNALPDELKELLPHPNKKKWIVLLDSHKKDKFSLMTVGDLCSLLNIEMREKLTLKQSKNLISAGHEVGFQLIPDLKILGKPYRWTDKLFLSPFIEKYTALSDNFYAAALIFDLSYSVASSDAPVTVHEMVHLNRNIIQNFFILTEFEKKCLYGFQEIRKIQPESFEKLASRLKDHLKPDQRITVGKFLLEIAFYDNILTPDEQRALKKAFTSLDIDIITSDTLIAEALSLRNQQTPVIIQKGGRLGKGESLPPKISEISQIVSNSEKLLETRRKTETTQIVINSEKLLETRRNTEEVQKLLVLVFNETELDHSEPDENEKICEFIQDVGGNGFNIELLPFPQASIVNLEARYYPILYEILKLNNLNHFEFDKLVRNYGCMPKATVQEINNWSDEEFGDFILEENNGTIIVNRQNIVQ